MRRVEISQCSALKRTAGSLQRKAPAGTVFKFEGGATQVFGGALYFPKGDVSSAA